jgi:hypothetical protein
MKRSARVDIHGAVCGQSAPIKAPNTMPAKTCSDLSWYNGRRPSPAACFITAIVNFLVEHQGAIPVKAQTG